MVFHSVIKMIHILNYLLLSVINALRFLNQGDAT